MTPVSIIVPAYNEEKYIGECLKSLSHQTWTNREIIVVDDGSTDRTLEIVGSFSEVRVLRQNHQGPGAARNFGAKNAKGEILVFVDADMTFAPDYVEKLIWPILQGEAIGTFHKDELVKNQENFWARWWNINYGLPVDRRLPVDYPDTQEVFRAILKSEFEKVSGFDLIGYDDDHTLARKLKKLAQAAEGVVCYHNNPSSLPEVFKSARWIGKSAMVERNLLGFWHYFPLNPFRKGWKEAMFRRQWFLPIYRMIYGTAICLGMLDYWLTKRTAK